MFGGEAFGGVPPGGVTDNTAARVTSLPVEVVYTPLAAARVTSLPVEVIVGPATSSSATDVRLIGELTSISSPDARITGEATSSLATDARIKGLTPYGPFLLDDFNRANGALGSNWTQLSGLGSVSITSNAVTCGDSTLRGRYWNNSSIVIPADHEAVIQAPTQASSQWWGVMTRLTNETSTSYNCYRLIAKPGASTTQILLEEIVSGGVGTTHGTVTLPNAFVPNGSWLRLNSTGSTQTAYLSTDGQNWEQLFQVTDSTQSTGKIGFLIWGTSTVLDNFMSNFVWSATDVRITGLFTGTDTSTDYDARITGEATSSDSRDVRIFGHIPVSTEQDARTTGEVTTSDSRDARITGTFDGAVDYDIRTVGQDTNFQASDVRIFGHIPSSQEYETRTVGTDTSNVAWEVYITGELSISDAHDAKVTGQDSNSTDRDVHTTGTADTFNSDDVRITGEFDSARDHDARIQGTADTFYDQDIRVTGEADSIQSHDTRVIGQADSSTEVEVRLTAEADSFLDTDVRIFGHVYVENTVDVFLIGEADAECSVMVEVIGVPPEAKRPHTIQYARSRIGGGKGRSGVKPYFRRQDID